MKIEELKYQEVHDDGTPLYTNEIIKINELVRLINIQQKEINELKNKVEQIMPTVQ